MKVLKEILSEDGGNLSSMRVIVGLVVLTIVGTWAHHCVITGTLVGFDYEEIALLVGMMGVKAYQKGKEA